MTSVTVAVPMTIRRRSGRKQIIGPDGTPAQAGEDGAGVATTRGDPALVKALARAHRWKRLLESGRYASVRELARAENLDHTYLAKMLSFTLLAPDLIEAILDGREHPEVTLRALLAGVPPSWDHQRAGAADAGSVASPVTRHRSPSRPLP